MNLHQNIYKAIHIKFLTIIKQERHIIWGATHSLMHAGKIAAQGRRKVEGKKEKGK